MNFYETLDNGNRVVFSDKKISENDHYAMIGLLFSLELDNEEKGSLELGDLSVEFSARQPEPEDFADQELAEHTDKVWVVKGFVKQDCYFCFESLDCLEAIDQALDCLR